MQKYRVKILLHLICCAGDNRCFANYNVNYELCETLFHAAALISKKHWSGQYCLVGEGVS